MTAEAPPPALADPPAQPGPLRFGLALLTTVTAGWILLQLGEAGLAVPLTGSGDLRAWVDTTPPVVLAMGVLRLATLLLCGYLTIALVVNGGAAVAARGRATWRVRLLPTFLQHLLVGGVSIGLAVPALPLAAPTTALAAAVDPTDDNAPDSTDTAVMVKLGDDEPAPVPDPTPTTSAPPEPPPATEDASEPPTEPAPTTATTVAEEQPSTGATTETSDPASSAPVPPEAGSDRPQHGDTWIVEPGDSFWSIAEEVVADHITSDAQTTVPSDDVVGRYWADLIAANREQLADPEDPDLLFSGQHLHLPLWRREAG